MHPQLRDRFSGPSHERDRRESEIEAAEVRVFERMKPVNEIVAVFLAQKDAMAALSQRNGTPAVDVAIVFESVSEWAGGIRAEIRKEEFQGNISWLR